MEIHFCKNHPERIAHYRCYYCKTPICSKCRLTLDHHYFCSYKCFINYKIRQLAKKLPENRVLLLWGIQLLLFAFLMAQFFYFSRKVNQPPPPDTIAVSDTAYLPAVKSYFQATLKESGEKPLQVSGTKIQKTYQLRFPLKKGWVISVWKNGQPFVTEMIRNDSLYTVSVPLNYGRNAIRFVVMDQAQHAVARDEHLVEYRTATVEALRHSISRGDVNQRRLALTFDGGSDATHTAEILSILKDFQVRCTMFLTGKFMERYPEMVRQILADGHEIGNHTYNHPHLTTYEKNRRHDTATGVNRQFVWWQLNHTDSIFYNLAGQHLRPFWRAPFGEYNKQILSWAAEAGYLHIRWTRGFDTFDWVTDENSKLFRTPEEFLEHFKSHEKNDRNGVKGVIVLMHLGSHRNGNHIFEALPQLIEFVRGEGYRLVQVSQLLQE